MLSTSSTHFLGHSVFSLRYSNVGLNHLNDETAIDKKNIASSQIDHSLLDKFAFFNGLNLSIITPWTQGVN